LREVLPPGCQPGAVRADGTLTSSAPAPSRFRCWSRCGCVRAMRRGLRKKPASAVPGCLVWPDGPETGQHQTFPAAVCAASQSASPAPRFRWTLICDKECQYVQHETRGFRARARSPEGDGSGAGIRPRRQGPLVGQAQDERGAGTASRCRSGGDSRKHGVTAATLSEWREAFLAAGEEGLKIRQEDLVDEQGRRMKSVIAELAMENELLRERIRRIEDEQLFLRWTRNGFVLLGRPSW
jgi:hypothetical protein